MAFGFERLSGTSRRYVNRSNPDFAIGQVISRRQYTAYTDRVVREFVAEEQGAGAAAIAETDAMLADLRDSLTRRERQKGEGFTTRQGAGQRRYNAALEAYVRNERARGRHINKREAARSSEFKQIMEDLRGRSNKRRNRRIMDENRVRRQKALDKLGGDQFFRNQYESLYGGRTGGHGRLRMRRDSKGNPTRRAA